MPPLESISPMATDPPTLLPFAPLIQRSPIINRVLTFDEIGSVHNQQTSGYPQVEDTSSFNRCPDIDTTRENVAEISNVSAFDDHVDIELALRNTNLDGCKDALP